MTTTRNRKGGANGNGAEPPQSLLDKIESPADLARLDHDQMACLAEEIRRRIVDTVDANGGHLASNLGIVELTIAIHVTFDLCRDRVLWDVSHQTYAHKLLTGRAPAFSRLRTAGGLSGFSCKRESPYDLFDAGHAGTAVSVGAGLAVADKLAGRDGKTIVVLGDAACACGVSFEGLNFAGAVGPNLLVILNDNRMSISRSVGALSHYLHRIRTKPFWRDLVAEIHSTLQRVPFVGRQLDSVAERIEEAVRHTLVPGLLFQELGFRYFGPIDGHDLAGLRRVLGDIRTMHGPVLLHVHTVKGKGYEPAEKNPAAFHGLRRFLQDGNRSGERKQHKGTAAATFTDVFAESLVELGTENKKLCAVTAAMVDGTGVAGFASAFPDRAFDVGIAEEHGACFASGLVFGGRPTVYAVYSTFVQRAYDQIFHDVCLQGNPVVICLDRAGIVGEDGPTHHGAFDIALLRHLPSIVLAAPRDARTLRALLRWAVGWPQPVVIRYPRDPAPESIPAVEPAPLVPGRAEVVRRGRGVAIVGYGAAVPEALRAADLLSPLAVTVVDARFAKPIDTECLRDLARDHEILVTVEDHALSGGFGGAVLEALAQKNISFRRVRCLGIPDRFVRFGRRRDLLAELGLTGEGIQRAVAELVRESPAGFPEGEHDIRRGGRRLLARSVDRWNGSGAPRL